MRSAPERTDQAFDMMGILGRRGREAIASHGKGALAWSAAILVSILAIGLGELLIDRIQREELVAVQARAEVGAGVVGQVVLRRLEAVDVMHRLAQSWFLLRSRDDQQGQTAIETEMAETANSGRFGFVQIATIDQAGWMTWSSISGTRDAVYLGDREHFRVHAEGLRSIFISRPVLGRVSKRYTAQLTRPLYASDGSFGGVVVVSMDLVTLGEALADVHFETWDRAMLLRDDVVAAHSDGMTQSIGSRLPDGDALRTLPLDQVHGALMRQSADGRLLATGWHRLVGTPLLAAFDLDVQVELERLGQTRSLVRTTSGAVVALALMLVGLMRTNAGRRQARMLAEQAETERRLAEEAHATYSRRIAGLPAVVYGGEVQADGRFDLRHVSESLARITGWSSLSLTGDGWQALMDPTEADRQAEALREVLATGSGIREYRLRRADGEWIWVRNSVRVVDRRADGSAEIVGYLADISAEREIRMKAQFAGRLATLGEMATGLAHELNQPLAVMSLAADNAVRLLQKRGAAAMTEVQERLSRIGMQARRARDIVDHLRVYGRTDEGVLEPLSLSAALEGALVLTNGALRSAGIEVTTELPPDLPQISARLVPLEQAMVNLLLNARDQIVEQMRTGGSPWIRITAAVAGDTVKVSLADSGGGIPEHILDRLFEPFFTTKPPGKGTGLGLSICHATMRSFGGEITAANGPGGAIFTLTFRLAAPVPAASARVQEAPVP